MKNVLHISSKSAYDGTSVYPLNISLNLHGYNHSILFIEKGAAHEEMRSKGVSIFALFNEKATYGILSKIFKFLFFTRKTSNIDIIHYHSGGIVILFLITLIFHKQLIIQHIHCSNITCSSHKEISFIHKLLYKLTSKKIIKIASSKRAFDTYVNITGNTDNILLVENSVPVKFQKKKQVNKRIGYLGQISEDKGADFLIELIKSLPEQEFLIKGEIKQQKYFTEIICLKNVKLVKPDLNILLFFENIDILLFPSKAFFETSPLVIWEALFSDTTVIINKKSISFSSLTDYIYAIDNFNIPSLKVIINDYYSNQALREKLSCIHQEFYFKNKYEIMIDHIAEIYSR